MFKFKVGDQVQITAGKDKGKKNKIEKIWPSENKVTVAGVNLYKRHKKATRSQPAGIFEITRPINVANIALICPKCSKVTRIGIRVESSKTGSHGKIRICKKCKSTL